MGTLTAQALIGGSHMYHGGIGPTHYIFLSENSRPAWIMTRENISEVRIRVRNAPAPNIKTIWIPTVKDMLEDLFLMVAVKIKRDKEIVDFIKENIGIKILHNRRLCMYDSFTDSQREELYKMCQKQSDEFPKIILSVFKSSTIYRQLPVIKKYKMEIEICPSVYVRGFDVWNREIREIGDFSFIKKDSG